MSDLTVLKKMSASAIVPNLKQVAASIEADKKTLDVYRIWGAVDSIRTGESKYGDGTFVAFRGDIEAANLLTGELFYAPEAFLHEPLASMIKSALAAQDRVEFAMTVALKRRDELAVGYEFICKPIVETQRSDALAHLRAVALPKPEDENTAEPVTQKKKGKAA